MVVRIIHSDAYVYDLQDNVIGLVDSNSIMVVEYKYDAWGRPIGRTGTLEATLGTLNPFRYRGYIWDDETGLYYLRTRYYNPDLCRFISADAAESLGADGDILGYQLFAYCQNDPVNRRDENGSWGLPNWAKVAIGAALIIGAAVVATVATGGVACFAAGAAVGAAKGALSGAVGGAITGAIQSRIETGNWNGALEAAIDGAADGFLGGAVGGFITGGLTSSNCFVAGTLVQTEQGPIPIEQIRQGQLVWAEDPETGERALKHVVHLFRNTKKELVHVNAHGEVISCTTEHPFYVCGKGWVPAKDLMPGDQLELLHADIVFVDSLTVEHLENPVDVYNFEVEDFHTYFISSQSILVHNVCTGNHGKAWNSERRRYWREQGNLYKNSVNGQLSKSGTYRVDAGNVERMLRGCAPKGTDGLSVALHHNQGIVNDFANYKEILTSVHRADYRTLHPWVFR